MLNVMNSLLDETLETLSVLKALGAADDYAARQGAIHFVG